MSTMDSNFGTPLPIYQLPIDQPTGSSERAFLRIGHLDLDYPTGIVHGLQFPIITEGEALGSPLLAVVRRNLPRMGWPAIVNWLRVLGVRYITLAVPEVPPGTRIIDRTLRFGVPTALLEVANVAPTVWWPDEVLPVESASAAMAHVARASDPVVHIAAPAGVTHQPGATLDVLEESPDSLRVRVSGPGGVLAFRRAYHPVLRATVDGEPTRTVPIQVALLGVEVPPGSHTVEVGVPRAPDRLALAASLIGGLAVALLFRTGARRDEH